METESYYFNFERLWFFSLFILSTIFWLFTSQDDPFLIKIIWSIIILGFIIYWSRNLSAEWYIGIVVAGACLRFWIESFEGFSQLPTQDSRQDLQVIQSFIELDSILVLPNQTIEGLTKYSAFPVLHSFAITLSVTGGLGDNTLAFWVTMWLYLAFVCSSLSLMVTLSNQSSLGSRIVPIGLIIVCFEPISVYWTGQMVRQLIGLVLVIALFALVTLFFESKYRIRLSILICLVSLLQPASHHLSSANAILIILGVSIIMILLSIVFNNKFPEKIDLSLNSLTNLIVILAVTTVLWWEIVGTYVAPFANGIIDRIWTILTTVQAEEIETVLNPRPGALTPARIIPLVYAKVVAIFGSVALGFVYMNWEKKKSGNFFQLSLINSYVFVSFSWFLILFLWAESTRVILFSIPVMALSSGYILNRFWENAPARIAFISAIFIGSMFAPYSFGYTPAFYFEDEKEGPDFEYGQFSDYNNEISLNLGPEIDYSSVFIDTPWALLNPELSFEETLELRTIPVGWRADANEIFCENCTLVLIQGGFRYYHLQGGGGYNDLTYEHSILEQKIMLDFLEASSPSKVFDGGGGASVFKY